MAAGALDRRLMAAAFAITTPSDHVVLDGERHVAVPFTVENDSGRALDVQAQAVAVDGADPGWFSVAGTAIVHLQAGARNTYQVEVRVPASAAAGDYAFFVVASDVSNPDDHYTDGPRVAFHVGGQPLPPPPPPITDAGYVATFLGAFAGDVATVVLVILAMIPIAISIINSAPQTGNILEVIGNAFVFALVAAVIAVILAAVILLFAGPVGTGLGAFLVLRARHYEAAGWTGLAVAVAQFLTTPLVALAGAQVSHLPRVVAGVVVTLLVIVWVLLPATVARGLVLLIRGKFVWPWVDIFRPRTR